MSSIDALNGHTQLAFAPPLDPPSQPAGGQGTGADGQAAGEFSFFGKDGFTFLDFLDVINPLQHIPLVGTAYRAITGDHIDPGARIAGGTLFGGPIGAAVSVANVAIEHNTGSDLGEHVIALFEGDGEVGPGTFEKGPVETADRDVREHIEVLRWAERETAFHAALEQDKHRPERMAQAETPAKPAARDTVAPTAPAHPGAIVSAAETATVPHTTPPAIAPGAIAPQTSNAISPGAPTPGGGWFSDAMLSALTRYQESQTYADLVAKQHTTLP